LTNRDADVKMYLSYQILWLALPAEECSLCIKCENSRSIYIQCRLDLESSEYVMVIKNI